MEFIIILILIYFSWRHFHKKGSNLTENQTARESTKTKTVSGSAGAAALKNGGVLRASVLN